ncbi:MAG: AAA family ATPase [Candidatus Hodarchaeales archaeon]|jgi:transitional endoplasmic reticulum ATPase
MVESKDKEPILLRVEESLIGDSGRGIARLPRLLAFKSKFREGSTIIIKSKDKATVATVKLDEVYDSDFIRLDNVTRKNAGVSINENVIIEPITPRSATEVTIAPIEEPLISFPGIEKYVREYLEGRVVTRFDLFDIRLFNETIVMTVSFYEPKEADAVIFTPDTELKIRTNPVEIMEKIPKLTWLHIGGLHDEIAEIREAIELPMHYPEIFAHLGIAPPKGVLLVGPPGTGKTLIARILANEIEASFFPILAPELIGKHLGQTPDKLKSLFIEAEKKSPSVIFIDEIESIAPKRKDMTYDQVMRNTVSALLSLMDGLKSTGRVIVLGATNQPESMDPAIRRNGRFDKEIHINVPNINGRMEILQITTKRMALGKVDLELVAENINGFVGADIVALCREAAMNALRRVAPTLRHVKEFNISELKKKLIINQEDFDEAIKQIQPSTLRDVALIEAPNVKWEDIGGLEEIKNLVQENIEWPLKYPKLFKYMGAKRSKGILLFGAPGTGKTTIARALATQSSANFISVKGPELLNKWLGKSEEAIRELFKKARQSSPCIIFFDEIDSITPIRGRSETNVHVERVMSQILTEIDGLVKLHDVIVVGATNRPEMIDKALLRPGRLGLLIHVPVPDKESRMAIFRVHTRDKPLGDDVNIESLAEKTENYTGADIEGACNRAAMLAIKHYVSLGDYTEEMESAELFEKRIKNIHFEATLRELKSTVTPGMKRAFEQFNKTVKELPVKESPRLYF